MPASAIQHQDGNGSGGDALADLHQVLVHRLDIHLRHDDRRAGLALWADGAEQVDPFVAAIAQHTRAAATFRPDTGYRSLLPDACLISEPDLDRFACRLRRQSSCYKSRKLELKTACSSGLLCRCCGRTDMCRNDNLCNSLPTVLSCRSTENSSRIRFCKSTQRQRTTPCCSKSGPCSTHLAILACCSADRRGAGPLRRGWLNSP